MSKKKRALSLILCFVMVFSLLTVIPATSVTPKASADAWTSMDRTTDSESNIKLVSGPLHNSWDDAEYLPTTYYMSPGDTVTISRNKGEVQEYRIISGPGTLTRNGDTATYTATNTGNVKVGVKVTYGINYYGAVNIKVIDKCTLSYNLNGGSGTFDSVDQFKGNTVTISSSKPSFTGYTFQYWQGSNGTRYYGTGTETVTLNSNLKLTAVWKQNGYNPMLLKDVLDSAYNNVSDKDKTYSVKTLNVNLFDYDADVFNGYYMNHNTTPAQDFFQFRGSGESIFFSTLSDGIGEGIHYGKNTVAKQNILNPTLTNNLPTMRYGLNVDLFNPNDETVKTVYKDVSMEFIQYGNCYYYSSYLNHMQLNSAGNALELYADNLSLGMSGTDENYNVGNFWPFSNISNSLDNSAAVVSGVSTVPGYAECSGSGEAKAKNYISGWSQYVGQITTPIYANRAMETTTEGNLTNHHFGLSMETRFYMPNSRTVDGTSTGDGMKFEFSGDDDLWVFIDDYLVLDIGGGHKALYGYIDFKNDEVYVSNAVTVTGANTNAGDEGPKTKKISEISDINSSLLDGGMHTMRIFYLERHGGASNCCIKFNLPVVPIPSVTVQNQVADQSGELLSSESDTFTYYLQNEDGTGLANVTYTVGNAEFETGTDGKFTLAANQFATFTNIGPNTKVKVVQAQPTNVTNPAKYDGVKIDFIGDTTDPGKKGTNYTSGTYLMDEGSVNRYVFTNYVKEYDLSTSGEHAILTPASEHYIYDAANKTEVSIAPESGYIITAITVDGTAYNTAQVVAAAKAGKITIDHKSSHSIQVVAEKSDTDKITVIDFGLPVKVSSLYDVVGLSATAPSVATITGGTDRCEFTANTVELSYGKASIDAENNKNVDYTPTKVLQSKDTFYTAYEAATGFRYTQVDIIPAADVYYEENSFVSYEGKWTPVGKGYAGEIHSGDKNNVYGYDETYGQYTEYSLGTAKQVTVSGSDTAKASFTFTGTGFEIYSACTAEQGGAVISVYNKDNQRVGMKKLVATVSSGDYWQTPIYMQNLDYGTYRVDIEVAYSGALDPIRADGNRSGSVTFILDGVRIYNTNGTYNDKYAADEQNVQFISVRDKLITKESFNEGTTVGAVFIDGRIVENEDKTYTYEENITTENVSDYKNFGPKNEVYLAAGQAVAFRVDKYSGESLQLGMKAANLNASTVNVNGQTIELAGSTAMYYKITSSDGTVVIANSGEGLVSITNLKISGAGIDTAAVPRGLSVDNDVVSYAASVMMAIREEPAPSEEPQPTEEPTPTEEPEPTEEPDPTPTEEPDEGDDDDGGQTVTVWEKLINAAKRLNEAIKSFVSKLFGR